MSVRIYVEGGGTTNALKSECRRGFSQFFAKFIPPEVQAKIWRSGSWKTSPMPRWAGGELPSSTKNPSFISVGRQPEMRVGTQKSFPTRSEFDDEWKRRGGQGQR